MNESSSAPPRLTLRFGALTVTPDRHRVGRVRALRQLGALVRELKRKASALEASALMWARRAGKLRAQGGYALLNLAEEYSIQARVDARNARELRAIVAYALGAS